MIYQSPASFIGDTGSLRKAGFDPETFLPVPTFGTHLVRYGIRPYAFQHQTIAHSGLSTMLLAGVDLYPYRSLSDLWVGLDRMLDNTSAEQNYTYIYWGDLDEHSHRFGPGDPRVALELAGFSRQLSYFIHQRRAKKGRPAKANGDTLLLITADHGHIATPRRAEYELRNHPRLFNSLVMAPSGEARLPYVYLRPGHEEAFMGYLAETWPGQFLVVPAQSAIEAGLFGNRGIYEKLPERVGDFVIIPQAGAYWWFGSHNNPLLGRHGGISRVEMLAPLLSVAL